MHHRSATCESLLTAHHWALLCRWLGAHSRSPPQWQWRMTAERSGFEDSCGHRCSAAGGCGSLIMRCPCTTTTSHCTGMPGAREVCNTTALQASQLALSRTSPARTSSSLTAAQAGYSNIPSCTYSDDSRSCLVSLQCCTSASKQSRRISI